MLAALAADCGLSTVVDGLRLLCRECRRRFSGRGSSLGLGVRARFLKLRLEIVRRSDWGILNGASPSFGSFSALGRSVIRSHRMKSNHEIASHRFPRDTRRREYK